MKIAITGALGHIGSGLIRHLTAEFPSSSLIMIDNMMTQRYTSLFNLPLSGNYNFVDADVLELNLDHFFSGVDFVIHLAAMTDAAGSFAKKSKLESHNYQVTKRVVESCSRTHARLLFLSSTSVYGSANDVVSENCSMDELNPQSPYAETKIKEESLVKEFCDKKGLNAVICRFGTIYGKSPGIRFHTAVNKFCWQASLGLPITVWKTAYDQKRPYLDLFDACRAISFIIRNELFEGEIYNILTHNKTVHQIVDAISEFVPTLEIEFVKSEIMNQLSYDVSTEKFKSKGFVYKGDLKRGIKETLMLFNGLNTTNKNNQIKLK